MRCTIVLSSAAVLLTACGGGNNDSDPDQRPAEHDPQNQPQSTADCLPAIKHHGKVYGLIGYTSDVATKTGTAQKSRCADVGKNARGSYFPDNAPSVTAYSFKQVAPATAVAIPENRDRTYDVYMPDSIPPKKAQHILIHKLD
ncbi:MAG: DUF6281 family protein, partial [Nocardioidaceae bacterium]